MTDIMTSEPRDLTERRVATAGPDLLGRRREAISTALYQAFEWDGTEDDATTLEQVTDTIIAADPATALLERAAEVLFPFSEAARLGVATGTRPHDLVSANDFQMAFDFLTELRARAG